MKQHKAYERSFAAALAISDLKPVTDEDRAANQVWQLARASDHLANSSPRPLPDVTVVHEGRTWVQGPEHACGGSETLCGLADEQVIVLRGQLFSLTNRERNCRECQTVFREQFG